MRRYIEVAFSLVLMLTFLAACDSAQETDLANIQFHLTDMPGEYQQVNIDVQGVNVMMNDTMIELTTNQGIYNLLDFVNGRDTLLVDDEVPAGFISQIRLVLGENNTVMVDDEIHEMKTPSAQQSGLKLNVHNEFLPGESYAYVIDFIVEKSIVETGNGKYILKPVIKVFTEAITGSIKGVVDPAEVNTQVMAILEDDTSSANTDLLTGAFMIRGLPEGTYNVEFHPMEGFNDTVLNNIMVIPGQITELDTMYIL